MPFQAGEQGLDFVILCVLRITLTHEMPSVGLHVAPLHVQKHSSKTIIWNLHDNHVNADAGRFFFTFHGMQEFGFSFHVILISTFSKNCQFKEDLGRVAKWKQSYAGILNLELSERANNISKLWETRIKFQF